MKTTFLLLSVLAVSLGAARAQDASYDDYSYDSGYAATDYEIQPAVVYNAPVTYAAPVVYNMPVVYNAPVYYGLPNFAMGCAMNACASASYDLSRRSTVTYIGGGHAITQVSPRC